MTIQLGCGVRQRVNGNRHDDSSSSSYYGYSYFEGDVTGTNYGVGDIAYWGSGSSGWTNFNSSNNEIEGYDATNYVWEGVALPVSDWSEDGDTNRPGYSRQATTSTLAVSWVIDEEDPEFHDEYAFQATNSDPFTTDEMVQWATNDLWAGSPFTTTNLPWGWSWSNNYCGVRITNESAAAKSWRLLTSNEVDYSVSTAQYRIRVTSPQTGVIYRAVAGHWFTPAGTTNSALIAVTNVAGYCTNAAAEFHLPANGVVLAPPAGNGTGCVSILEVRFKGLWETSNRVNHVRNTTPKDDPPATLSNRLYTVECPTDSMYHVTLDVDDEPSSLRSKLMWAVYDGCVKLAESNFPAIGPANIAFDHPTISALVWKDFELRVGYDVDGNATLDAMEEVPVSVTNTAGSVIGSPRVKGVSTTRYAACTPALSALMFVDPMIPHGKALLRIFLDGNMSSVATNKQPTQASMVTFNCYSDPFCVWLTHDAGATFDASGLASISKYVWSTNTSLAHLLCNSFTMKTAAEAFYNATVFPVAEAFFTTNPVGTIATFPLNGTSYNITHSNESPAWVDAYLSGVTVTYASKDPSGRLWSSAHDDARVTIGRGRVFSHTAQFTIEKKSGFFGDYLAVVSAHYTGLVKDLYDFNAEDTGPGGIAAVIQLGSGNGSYGTGRATGLIFRGDIVIDETPEEPF